MTLVVPDDDDDDYVFLGSREKRSVARDQKHEFILNY